MYLSCNSCISVTHVFIYYEFFILNYEIKHDALSFLTAIGLSLTLVVSLSPTLSRCLPTDDALSLSPHQCSVSRSHTHTRARTHTLSLSHTHTHTHTLTHTHIHSLSLSLPLTHTLSLSNSLSHTHTLSLSFKHTYSFKELNSPTSFKDGHIL